VAALNKALKDKVKCLHQTVVYDIVTEINHTGTKDDHLNPPRTPQESYDKFTNVLFRRLLSKNKFEAENGPDYKVADPRITQKHGKTNNGKGSRGVIRQTAPKQIATTDKARNHLANNVAVGTVTPAKCVD
jgi:hypothetical protein